MEQIPFGILGNLTNFKEVIKGGWHFWEPALDPLGSEKDSRGGQSQDPKAAAVTCIRTRLAAANGSQFQL